MKKSKYFFIYNSPDSTSIEEMSLEEAKAEYLDSDDPVSFSFDLDIDSTHGKIIALKGGDQEPVELED